MNVIESGHKDDFLSFHINYNEPNITLRKINFNYQIDIF